MNKFFKFFAVLLALLLLLMQSVQAAVPVELTAVLDVIRDDGLTIAVMFLVAGMGVAAMKFIRSAVGRRWAAQDARDREGW